MTSRKTTDDSLARVENVPQQNFVMYTTWPDMIRHWPKTTFCIVSNEFCERFSYYGMRTVLVLYLLNVLKFSENQSTIFFNVFTVLCYTTPMLGSIIADGYIGKFWTIFSVSIIYAIGQVILAIASTKNYQSSVHPAMDLAGLIIIGFGTGGIKPCVAAFGGDQFENGQERMLSIYFSMFYFSINAGSMISTFISPIFRSLPCMGLDSCYPLAFGIPAILMIVATCIFMAGSFWYKKNPPKENIFGEVARLMWGAFWNMFKATEKRDSWLEYYLDTHDCTMDAKCCALREETNNKTACSKVVFIYDTRMLGRVLIMFLPVPMFWALYDQQGSVWLIQGIQMDCRLSDNVLFLPDQVQTLNAVLILVFIPVFQVIIYPLFGMCFKITPLRKMVAGGLLAALSFLITGFVQIGVNTTLPTLPGGSESFVSVWNQIDTHCGFSVTVNGQDSRYIPYNGTLYEDKNDKSNTQTMYHVTNPGQGEAFLIYANFTFDANCTKAVTDKFPPSYSFIAVPKKIYYIAVSDNGVYHGIADPAKPTQGTGEFSLSIVTAMTKPYGDNLAMCRFVDNTTKYSVNACNPKKPADFYYWEKDYDGGDDHDIDDYYIYTNKSGIVSAECNATDANCAAEYTFKPVKPGKWGLYYLYTQVPKDVNNKTWTKDQLLVNFTGIEMEIHEQGGVYVLALTGDDMYNANKHVYQVVQSNSVSILWQIPQIVVITAAEILFSITGIEFAYSQSAPSMKSLVQALWLFTTAIGDSIIVAITAIDPFDNMATMFFAYAIAMTVVIGIFALLSIFYYDYNDYAVETQAVDGSHDDDDDECSTKRPSLAIDNKAFQAPVEEDEFDYKF